MEKRKIKYIHVNQHKIKANLKHGTNEPVITVKEGKCALTGLFMTYHKDGSGTRGLNASIDRIDPDIEYLVTNIQLVCSRANIIKHTLKEDELYWWAKNIVESKEND